jgi:hypothetical protein
MEKLKNNLRFNAVSLLFIALLLSSSLILWSPNIAHAQGAMTFTSGDTVNFHSNTQMTIKSNIGMTFWSGIEMGFGTGIQTKFTLPASGMVEPCTTYTIIAGWALPTYCTWWELLNQTTGNPTGYEFHVDTNPTSTKFHIDLMIPGALKMNFALPVVAEMKIDSLEYCDTFKVHWPIGYIPEACSWWEIISPEQYAGYEFHVDGSSTGEFHIDYVLPQAIILPPPGYYEIVAIQKIQEVAPCTLFVVEEPRDWWPGTCTWWEIIDHGMPTGFEFHVDWTNESCEFHVDGMYPKAYILPEPGLPYIYAEQKIVNITTCDYFRVDDPQGFNPDPDTWWEIIDPITGAPTGMEFHVDSSDGFGLFHVDATIPEPINIPWMPPSYTLTVREKISIIQQCSWFRVDDPLLTPEYCSWWKIISPHYLEPLDIEIHVDTSYPQNGTFHIDYANPVGILDPPVYELIAERKIEDIAPCDTFSVISPPGFVPSADSWWNITSPTAWAGVKFHVDSTDGISQFHIDRADQLPPSPIPPPWNVTAESIIPPGPYYKPSYPDYAPSGMPDFDQKQDNWLSGGVGWTWCGPVSVANSLWWFDSKYDPIDIVTAYQGIPDDHSPLNVKPLVTNLAFLMDTDGIRTHLAHTGTSYIDMQVGISQYLQQQGINPVGDCDGDGDVDAADLQIINDALWTHAGDTNWNMAADIVIDNYIDNNDYDAAFANLGKVGKFYEHTEDLPAFSYIQDEILRCEDVVLLLEFWNQTAPGVWKKLMIPYDLPGGAGGHYVTCAGVNCSTSELIISDPWQDAFEAKLVPGRSPVPHTYPHTSTVHNDTQFVSQDAYTAALWIEPPNSPYPQQPIWELLNYLTLQGFPPTYHAFIRAAVVTSPLHDIATTNVVTGKTGCLPMPTVGQGMTTTVNVTVQNKAGWIETFTLTAYANSSVIGTTAVTLNAQETKTISFTWDTTGFAKGNYTISAYATPVLDEYNIGNNSLPDGKVLVTIPGDVDGSFLVDGGDLGLLGFSWYAKPGDKNWNPNADIVEDGLIDGGDLGILGLHWYESYP